MPFFLLTFNHVQDDVRALKYLLQQSPNGTLLCSAQSIRSRAINDNFRIYWWDTAPQNIEDIKLMKGVQSFKEMDVSCTIHDSDWKYEDEFIRIKLMKGVQSFKEMDVSGTIHDSDWK
jgi:hypothetical protein